MESDLRRWMRLVENEISGDVQGITQIGPIHYDQQNGMGAVPDNANVKYKGFACLMTPQMFLRLAEARDFSQESNLQQIGEALQAGKPIGSPFLGVQFDDVARVRQHEGRTRVEAIRQAFPNTSVLVHIFVAGGERARHLSLDKIAAFRAEAIPQKQKTPISGPHCEDRVWWLDGWKTLPSHLAESTDRRVSHRRG